MINVLIIGSGSYVSGKNTPGYGTILPAIIEAKKMNLIDNLSIASHNAKSIIPLQKKVGELKRKTGIDLHFKFYPEKGKNDFSYKQAIKELKEPSCVIIATPDHLHFKMTKHAIQKKKNVLVVKPLTPTLKETNELVNLAKKNKRYCAVDFHKRFDFANLKIIEIINQKKIGFPLYIHVEYSQKKIIPEKVFKDWAYKSNIFQYLAVHYVDIINFITKGIPIRLVAIGQKNYLKSKGVNTYDAIQVIIEWSLKGKKFTSTILCNWIDPNQSSSVSNQLIKIIGTKGRIESDQKNRGFQIIDDESGIEDINPYFNQTYPNGNLSKFQGYGIDSITQFIVDCISLENKQIKLADLNKYRPSFENTVVTSAIIEAVNKSLSNNSKWIHFGNSLRSK
jgi:predicted dehydrogenase